MSWKIKKNVLDSILAFSKSFYPNEFSALLFCDLDTHVIKDIYFLPGTCSNDHSAYLRLDLAPISLSLVGSIHSHPTGKGKPSLADLNFFSSKDINIITYFPFCLDCYECYNSKGEKISLEIVD